MHYGIGFKVLGDCCGTGLNLKVRASNLIAEHSLEDIRSGSLDGHQPTLEVSGKACAVRVSAASTKQTSFRVYTLRF